MSDNTATKTGNNVVNGVNTELLGNLAQKLQEKSDMGRVTFLSKTTWQEGTRVLSQVGENKLDGRLIYNGKRQFVEQSDQPPEFSGNDTAPGPMELLLHAIGSCITTTTNINAAFMGITLDKLEVSLESDIDLHGLFALDKNVRPGISELRACIEIDGDADADTLREVVNRGFTYSPVRDSVNNGITITPEIVLSAKA